MGDKTIAFWLKDKDMHDCMYRTTPSSVVDPGIDLPKMMRVFTLTLGGNHLVLLVRVLSLQMSQLALYPARDSLLQ